MSERVVTSADGAQIAAWVSGSGPPLVVVHGTPADHTRWSPLLPHLEPQFTVVALDRRGRGASDDGPVYSLEREYEDVAAVIDAVGAEHGSEVFVYGHSHGGLVAFGAASLSDRIARLALYEGWPLPDPSVYALPAELEARMDRLLAAGDRDAVVEALFRGLEDMSDEDMSVFKAAPSWAGRVAAAGTITREIRAETQARLEADHAAAIAVPVLLICGEESPDPARPGVQRVADVLPEARIHFLPGHGHVADVLEPEMFARVLTGFFLDQA